MTSTHLSPDEARVDVARDVTLFAIQHDPGGLPGNGGLRVLAYPDDAAALADARVLAARMTRKHRLYATGFGGFKLVARCDPADPAARRALLAAVAEVLNARRGALYTGCDLNTDAADMAHLTGLTPYVLAAVGSPVDASAATAWGVVGSLAGALPGPAPRSVLVHGAGKVGGRVAALLQRAGHRVYTHDLVPARAHVAGCHPVSHVGAWWRLAVDAVVLCSASYVVDEAIADELACPLLVSAANAPFAGDGVPAALARRGVAWLPDALSSAGAVLCDSIEHYNPARFRGVDPNAVYAYVHATVAARTAAFVAARAADPAADPDDLLAGLTAADDGRICGLEFTRWQESR